MRVAVMNLLLIHPGIMGIAEPSMAILYIKTVKAAIIPGEIIRKFM
jgi:hypothetical protein